MPAGNGVVVVPGGSLARSGRCSFQHRPARRTRDKAVPKGDEVPLARDVVTYLLIRFLATGERWTGCRLRCRDVLPSGRRVLVGPFWDSGLDLANCGDRYRSPGIGLASANVPPPKR